METYVNQDEISASYKTMGNLYSTEITGLDQKNPEQTSPVFLSGIKVTYACRFLKFSMKEQLFDPGDQTRGSVEK